MSCVNTLRGRLPDWLAGGLLAVAALCAVAAVSAALGSRVHPVRVTVDALLMPAPANLGYAAILATLAAAVHNRKRVIFWVLLVFLGAQGLFDVFVLLGGAERGEEARELRLPWHGPAAGLANVLITAVLLALLWLARGGFSARVQRASLPKAVVTLGGLLALGIAVGWGLVELFPGSLGASAGAGRLAYSGKTVLGGAFGFDVGRQGRAPGWVNLILGAFGAVALFAAVFALLRSQRATASLDADEERRVRQLLAEHGRRDSLGYFATRRDKEVIFSPSGRGAVTYRVVFGVSLASGDPLGEPDAWPPAIEAWLREARDYAWTPAVMGAGEEGATAYARAGLRVLELGDEAILHVRDFDLASPRLRQVRQAVHRVERAGYTVRIRRHADIAAAEMARIIELAAQWRDTETERGFSMALGRLGDPNDGRCVLVEAHDRDGREVALLSFTPWGADGLSLDLMRRDRASDNGLVEYMVATLMRESPRLGVTRVSLNFAVFRAVFEEGARIGAGPVLRLWRSLLLFASHWFQLESLYRSNVKYSPQWLPRFLCFEDVRDLAKVGLASAAAEGFLVVPSLRTLLRRGIPAPADAPRELLGLDVQAPAQRRVPEQVRVRLDKLAALRRDGVEPYPPQFARTHSVAQLRDAHAGLAPDTRTTEAVSVAGRVVRLRDHGGLCFATLRDWSGDLQVLVTGDPAFAATVDLGDHVGVSGVVGTTRRGELSVFAGTWRLTAKCLRPLPDKHRGLADPEALVRLRHVDLIVNQAPRDMVRLRSATSFALRSALHGRGYVEVETPVLQPVHGGANARPFITHSNAYDMPLFLRIAPELYLKRLAVGGVERVFEIGRNFRNEGVDATHNPEFTMLEAYEAYGDYTSMRALARELILAAAEAGPGPVLTRDGHTVDLRDEWPVVPVYEAVSRAAGAEVTPADPVDALRALCDRLGVAWQDGWTHGQLVLELYEHLVEGATVRPTFYTDFPVDVSPLTRGHRDDPRLAERWDLVAFGMELGTAYTELVDPVELRARLTAQSLRAAAGDPEAMSLDEDFLDAFEFAMPPSGGLGLGVDRLVMLLTGRSIRETLPFPLVKKG
ncbi:bifunctional lysylphosphatidylglycerol synthetase/lysine--tRNA ligase LysX [Dactylosporangium aurantiacum]|uniref:Lysine--tRNA ligase n=1 Tax=Dactylosporangium aurantiacum TaxID=35754 RepID=A0A9Q9IVZ7_9ACTN|nr:bifunctional lysylphosphatidylglycerol synthetase/lysine--tRNA ligase LysX [Dactylosporangium aurantiacum]MDG6103346.1 bifunctional lysylphosphatidylglycerol synthetase/lysine--tRNA ligase LysX [Dactylosporangium aurantiacum]UWZ59938.1 bifunctional lysylphosphatidylglycerol synthetase/lysine--tRNA ligase LysX [Dactylosporangium aurantiacum]